MAGLEYKVNSNADLVKNATKEAIHTALEAVGIQAQGYATDNITANGTVDTGRLRASITYEVEDDTVVIGTNVHYAPYIEFGTGIYAESGGGRKTPWAYQDDKGNWHRTRGMRPKPFLRPAVEKHLDEFRDIITAVLSKLGN